VDRRTQIQERNNDRHLQIGRAQVTARSHPALVVKSTTCSFALLCSRREQFVSEN
jgi:hypothetical protein